MKNIENGLTRRALLGNGLKTAAGITLLGAPTLLSSCAYTDDWGYTFDTSGLNSEEFSNLFIEAGKHYWGVGDRNDSSPNKAYFGYIPPKPDGTIRRGRADWWLDGLEGDPIRGYDKVYIYRVIFNEIFDWANCDIEGESGADFFQVAAHEWGHIFLRRGNELHSDPNYPIMNAIDRC